jgi:hypothetical protein
MNIHGQIRLILEGKDPTDSITLDIPLLIRILELAREDVKDDMELHRITERLLKIRHQGVLTMDDYNFIANMKEEFAHELQEFKKQPDVAEDKDPCWTGYTQVGMKDKGGRKVPNCVPSKGVPKAKGYKESQDSLNPYDQYSAMAPAKTEAANPAQQAAIAINMKKKGIKPKNEDVHESDDAPFEKPYRKTSGTTTDKSGAKHTPMSKARHLAQQVMKKNAEKSVKEEAEQIDEISPATKASYVTKAKDQIKQSLPFTKKSDEYRDIAKNFIAKREKGIAKANEEVEQIDEDEDKVNARKMYHKHFVAAMKVMPSSAKQRHHQAEMAKYKAMMGDSFVDQVAPKKFAKFDKKTNEEVHELDEAGHLDRYIKSLGWDPKLLDMSRKQKYAQSSQYASWRQRQASVRTESTTAHEKFKAGVKKAGYDMDAGAKRLENLLAKQKKEREEREKAEKPEMKQETMMGKLANSHEPEGDSLVESKHPSKAAMMVKGIFNLHKKRKMNEETYDHEKDDKQEKSLGKKPKLEVNDEKDEFGKEKVSARAVLSGGKTETGTSRDTIEIDPMMRNRPGQGDISKKEGRLGIKGQEK